jgi:hypothetical protein
MTELYIGSRRLSSNELNIGQTLSGTAWLGAMRFGARIHYRTEAADGD